MRNSSFNLADRFVFTIFVFLFSALPGCAQQKPAALSASAVPTTTAAPLLTAAPEISATWEPVRLINGSPCIFRVKASTKLNSLGGTFLDKQVFFSFDAASGVWVGFAGIDIDTPPGSHPLALNGTTSSNQTVSFTQIVTVAKGFYPITKLTVPRKYVDPDPVDVERIKAERDLKNQLFSQITTQRLWSGSFAAPTGNATSGGFGSQRTYNGKRQSIHQGLDFRAATGTPVKAVNSGKVILARDLYFEGGCVVLDHGQGLLTIYMHLSALKVKEGDTITKGQLIALSGGTGRSTGPHLHLGVRWQGVYVDPATLLKISLPQ